MGMQLINIVLFIVLMSSFNCFSDGMFGQPSKYRGQAEYWGKKSKIQCDKFARNKVKWS